MAAGLAGLLVPRVLAVDGFFLDDLLYTHAAEYIGDHAPGAIWGDIPYWTRGAQRLYSILLAPIWVTLPTSPAYTVSHLFNVALIASAVVPAALLARQVVESPVLRVLAVALAIVLPSLTVAATLLTENLAIPLTLLAVYAISRTALRPTLVNQVAALALIAALTLTRLNLAMVFVALYVTVAVAEAVGARRAGSPRAWAAGLVRRRAPLLLALVVGVAAVVFVLTSGRGVFGTYSNSTGANQLSELWSGRDLVITVIATYTRSIVTGSFVFPFVLALAAALAAARGAFGLRAAVVAIATLSTLVLCLVAVSSVTKFGTLEERYAFYLFVPLLLFAAVGAERFGGCRSSWRWPR